MVQKLPENYNDDVILNFFSTSCAFCLTSVLFYPLLIISPFRFPAKPKISRFLADAKNKLRPKGHKAYRSLFFILRMPPKGVILRMKNPKKFFGFSRVRAREFFFWQDIMKDSSFDFLGNKTKKEEGGKYV